MDANSTNTEKDIGGKKNNKKIIVGKVYADWCGHCQSLKPEWAKMKKHIMKGTKRKNQIVFAEIEEKEMGNKLPKLEKESGVKVEANGYPTLFRIEGGKIDYYNGNRQSYEMANWFMRGGDKEQQQNDQMPGLMEDQQGGRRSRYNRFRRFHSRSRRHPFQNNRTRKNFEKKTPGFFDFLFGSK